MTLAQKILWGIVALFCISIAVVVGYAGLYTIFVDGDWYSGLLMLAIVLLVLIQPVIYSRQARRPTVTYAQLHAVEVKRKQALAEREIATEAAAHQKLVQAERTRVSPERYHTKRPKWSLGVAGIIVFLVFIGGIIAFATDNPIPEIYLWPGLASILYLVFFFAADQDYDKAVAAKDEAGLTFPGYDYANHFYTDNVFSYAFYLSGKIVCMLLLLAVLATAVVAAFAIMSGISINPTTVIIVLLVLIFIRLGDIARRL